MQKLKITDTTIRDILQSVNPDSLNMKSLERIIELADSSGFESLEVWGGASFEKILESSRYNSSWDYLAFIKSKTNKTPLQALIGAKNLVSLDYFPDKVIKKFIKLAGSKGISIFRVYDALNDIENMKKTIEEVLKSKYKCQGTIIYDKNSKTDFYLNLATALKGCGCSSICIKDAESTMTPERADEIFSVLSKNLEIDFFLSTNNLRGLQVLNTYSAVKNGCCGFDLSFISSNEVTDDLPPIFPLLSSINKNEYSHDLSVEILIEIFEEIKKNIYPFISKKNPLPSHILNDTSKSLPPKWLIAMLDRQLSEIGYADKLEIVLDEILNIQNEAGSPSLSTPAGQIIGGQAILNTLISDSRWDLISDEMYMLLFEKYGKLPKKPDESLLKKIKSNKNYGAVFSQRNPDLYESCKKEMSRFSENEEDILSYCLFSDKTLKFLKRKEKLISSPLNGVKKEKDEQLLDSKSFLNPKFEESEKIKINEEVGEEKDMKEFSQLDMKKLKEVMDLLEQSNVSEIKIESGDFKISLNKKDSSSEQLIRVMPEYVSNASSSKELINVEVRKEDKISAVQKETEILEAGIFEIKSPIVGTYYCAASPGEKPYASEGSRVKKGDILCIIEAMKLMNKITSEHDGIIEKIYVKNEDPVEYGQTIMSIRADKND